MNSELDWFTTFLKTFIDGPLGERWIYLAEKGRWEKMQPWDLWSKSARGASLSSDGTKTGLKELAASAQPYMGKGRVLVTGIYDSPKAPSFAEVGSLSEPFLQSLPINCLLIVDPLQYAVCFCDDGQTRVFFRR